MERATLCLASGENRGHRRVLGAQVAAHRRRDGLADEQRRNRADLEASHVREAKALAAMQVEKASIEGQRKVAEADLGPVRHLATLLGTGDQDVPWWFILVVALLLDPGGRAALARRNIGKAINYRLKPILVRSTFYSCRTDPIEGSQRLRAKSSPSQHCA